MPHIRLPFPVQLYLHTTLSAALFPGKGASGCFTCPKGKLSEWPGLLARHGQEGYLKSEVDDRRRMSRQDVMRDS